MTKNKWWLNGGRDSGRTFRLLCELYENKIADIKANCDLAIEGRDLKIKELEKENKTLEGCLFAEQEHTQMLEQQIEKMKCCGNCKHCKYSESEESYEWCEKHDQVVNIAIKPCYAYEMFDLDKAIKEIKEND